jgi:iron complex outermembrane recepter protein
MRSSANHPKRVPSRFAGVWLAFALLGHREALAHEVVPPKPLVQPAPAWPNNRRYAHDVVVPVALTVAADGTVSDVQVEASVGADFDSLAVDVAKRWTFQPASSEGKPVPAKIRAIVRFVGNPLLAEHESKPAPNPSPPEPKAEPAPPSVAPSSSEATNADADTRDVNMEVEVVGERVTPPRSASETTRKQDVIRAAPHRTGGDLLQAVPGVFITQHSGQGKAYQVFYRGFDAVHGQDLEFWVGGAPVNEVSNIHGQGYADLHFVMPEVVSQITVLPGNYSPDQGDFAVAGTIRYDLGYREPGVTAEGTLGSFGERRVFLAYHHKDASPGSFAAFEAQSTDGFGPGRAASRTSGIAQQVFRVGDGRLRLLATGYAGKFDSPGVVRLGDIDSGKIDRFATYGVNQGGFSSRYQLVSEYSGNTEGSDWAIAPYVVLRGLKLKQNYTGYLLDESNGDSAQLINESTTLGVTGHYRHQIHWFSSKDSIEAGISVRNDWISQSQLDVSTGNDRVISTIVDAKIRAMDAAGWLDLAVMPIPRIKIRAGLRVDGLAYNVQDNTPATESRAGADPNAFARRLRPVSPGGQARTAMGTHYGPRFTVDGVIARGLHGLFSYGEGFRSPQARSLGDGEKTPFTTVQSMEAGLRYVTSTINGSLSAFRTTLNNDLVFDAATTRNEAVPASQRVGGALEFTIKPATWFVSSGSGTYTRATFTESDSQFGKGDKLPYVPELIIREDLAFTPRLGRIWSRSLTGRFGTALTGMFNRPQPYGAFGHDVFLIDATAELRLKEIAVGLDVFNLFDTDWYDSEFTYSANWNPGAAARLVPERYVTVGAPRTVLATLSLFVN